MNKYTSDKPMDDLLRARLRISEGATVRLTALRWAMSCIDWITRTTTGQPFFALREAEQVLIELDGRKGPELVQALMAREGGTTLTCHGLEHIPRTGAVIIGATHSVGTFDFIAHAAALADIRPDLKVVANREAERFLGKDRIIAVDLNSSDRVLTARQTLMGMEAHLSGGGALLVFGSGRVADVADGLLFEPKWRSGITRMSGLCNAPVIPGSANMRNSRYYYRTRRVARLMAGNSEFVGRTVASLRYVSELLEKLGGSYDVYYGPPQPAGSSPEHLQEQAEILSPGLYRPQ